MTSALAHRFEAERLMVIVPDRLSDLVAKGEITERYYNPGNLFREVHLVLTNDDAPSLEAIQPMVGDAKLVLHNIDPGSRFFVRTMGFSGPFVRRWSQQAVDLARRVGPQLVRCHGVDLNGVLAREIHLKLGIPYVVSLHINPDEDVRGRAGTLAQRLRAHVIRRWEKVILQDCALAMPVYQPIVPYLLDLKVENFEVCYNVLNPKHLSVKKSYDLRQPARVLSVGRQIAAKNPSNLICAAAARQDVELTIVGDGPMHDELRALVRQCSADDRIIMKRSVPNAELCASLGDYDIFAVHSDYWELSKAVLEALLCGLPVLINNRRGAPVPELTEEICLLVENTLDGYAHGLERLIKHDDFREALGRRAFEVARSRWDPVITETRFVDIYKRVLAEQIVSATCRVGR